MRTFTRTRKKEESFTFEDILQPGTQQSLFPKVVRSATLFELSKIELLGCNYTQDELIAFFDSSLLEMSVGTRQLLSVPCISLCEGYALLDPITIDSGDMLTSKLIWDTTRLTKELYIRLTLSGVLTEVSDN